MNWRFNIWVIILMLAAATYGPARAQDSSGTDEGNGGEAGESGGGEGEEGGGGGSEGEEGGETKESSKTIDASFRSQSDRNESGAGVSYTVSLTPSLEFSTATSLGNGYSAVDQSVSSARDTSLGITYDPPSPWRLQAKYGNSYNLFRRPRSEVYEEFKTRTASNNVESLLNYDFSDDLKTGMTLRTAEDSTRVIISEGTIPPPTESRTHNYEGKVDYAVTKSTNISVTYNGGIDFSKVEVSESRTDPPSPVKVLVSRKKSDHVDGSVGFSKDVFEGFNLALRANGSKDIARDKYLEGATDSDRMGMTGSGIVTWTPIDMLTITNTSDVSRGKTLIPHKYEYLNYFNILVYDSFSRFFSEKFDISLKPSATSELGVLCEYDENESSYRGIDGELPDPEEDEDAAGECLTTTNTKVTGNVDISIGQDITFHMMYQRHDIDYNYFIIKTRDKNVSSNFLSGNIGFDWTRDLRVDVATSMRQDRNRYDATPTNDNDILTVDLGTGFLYSLPPATNMEFHVGISKNATTYPNPSILSVESASIKRSFSTLVTRQFGSVWKPSCAVGMDFTRSYFPTAPGQNKKDDTFYVTPAMEFRTSNALTVTVSSNYSNHVQDKLIIRQPRVDDWIQYINYSTSAGIAYAPVPTLTLSLNATETHNIEIRDRIRRVKVIPNETYFNMDAGFNFNF